MCVACIHCCLLALIPYKGMHIPPEGMQLSLSGASVSLKYKREAGYSIFRIGTVGNYEIVLAL